MTEDPCKDCKVHGRFDEALNGIKEWEKDAKETLKHIVTAKAAWSFFIVFLSVCLAVVGFLWRGQVAMWDKITLDHKESMGMLNAGKEAIGTLDKKLDLMSYKVEKHFEETVIHNRKLEKK